MWLVTELHKTAAVAAQQCSGGAPTKRKKNNDCEAINWPAKYNKYRMTCDRKKSGKLPTHKNIYGCGDRYCRQNTSLAAGRLT